MTVTAVEASARVPVQAVAQLPVVVIGAGPVGLAAAAHLKDRGLPAVVLEAGERVGAAMSQWGHIRTFTPWQYIVDATAEKLLAPTGWTRPAERQSPTGAEIVERYLVPLAAALGDTVRTGTRVLAVSREGLDRSRSVGREERPFVVRVRRADGAVEDLRARAVIDASGTWGQSNPLGASGLPALGEDQAAAAGFVTGPLPDVLGADRARFAGRTTLVVGMGHSAANTLVALAQLAREVPGTRIVWAIRGTSARRVLGGGTADQLPDRGRLGSDLADLVATGAVQYLTGFSTRELRPAADGSTVTVMGDTAEGERAIEGMHNVVAATGFRPDLGVLSELRLDLDPGLEAPRAIGPLVDPAFHSCGTVAPHGWRELAHESRARLLRRRDEVLRPGADVPHHDRQRAGALDRRAPRGRRPSRPTRSSSSSPRPGCARRATRCPTRPLRQAYSRTRRAAAPPPGRMPPAPGRQHPWIACGSGSPPALLNGRAGDAAAEAVLPAPLGLAEVSASRSGGCCG